MDYGPAPESAAMAEQWLDQHNRSFDLFIDGKWQAPRSLKYFKSVNPSNKKKLADLAEAGQEDVNAAVASAKKALKSWRDLSGFERGKYLYAIARKIQKHARLFSVLETMDNGKPIRESRDIDIPLVVRHFYHHAGWAQMRDSVMPDYEEVGVVGQIIPWNFPLLMLSWKVAPALAMGNTVVLKPAEYTSLTALLFCEICKDAGLPDGVLNIVTGAGKTGAMIVNHPDIQKVAFTGSTEVGKMIRKNIAGTGKKVSLELGGKSPFIVFDSADIDSAVEGVVNAIWFNQGQVCCAGSRLLVQENIEKKFIARLKTRMAKLRIGDPLDKSIDIGAIVAPVQVQTIEDLVKQGVEEGAELWQPDAICPDGGCFYLPSLFTDVSPTDTIAQEEIFGPVLVAMSFRTPQEAVALANNTRYGLAASIWTEDINLALEVAPKVKAGVVWVNCTNQFDAASGFGGYRESGFGREGGIEGLWEYVQPRWYSKLESPKQEKAKKSKAQIGIFDIDRTAKMYIGGKQKRPDGGYSQKIYASNGELITEVGIGNRKDIRNAVEAANKAQSWASKTGHQRAQVLYFLAENLQARADEFAHRITAMTGVASKKAADEVEQSIERIFYYAAYADKYDGKVHSTLGSNVTLAMNEPMGVVGVACPDESPLLGFISTVIPLVAMGNTVVAIPSEKYPICATDLYQVMNTSDILGGVVNIVTGSKDELAQVLAKHYDVEAIWYFGTQEGSAKVEELATENMKRSLVNSGKAFPWTEARIGQGEYWLRKASEVKNIWVPYGVSI